MSTEATTLDPTSANEDLRHLRAEDRIGWAVERFGPEAILLSSMQKTASVLMHMFHRLDLENEIVFVDTGFHFHETLGFRDEFMRRFRLNIVTIYPERTPEEQEAKFGSKLHLCVDGQKECCRLRKEEPFLDYVRSSGKRLQMIGARRADGGRRANVEPIAFDRRTNGYAFHPIFDWSDAKVEEYLAEHEAPVHPLHAQSYPSIGCACCTTKVEPGEDPRAGRWRHLRSEDEEGPTYCGINFTDGSGI